jgi:hypothetical protein
MSGDAPRFLAHSGSRGGDYTSNPARALDCGEAPSADEQRRITHDAARAARDRDRHDWMQSRDRLRRELDFLYSRRFQLDVSTQLRAPQRQLDRLDQRLGR